MMFTPRSVAAPSQTPQRSEPAGDPLLRGKCGKLGLLYSPARSVAVGVHLNQVTTGN